MDTAEKKKVDVGRIMAEIKREIAEKGLFDELPAFEQLEMLDYQVGGKMDISALRQKVNSTLNSVMIPADYPVSGNSLKRAFKKASQKATRCTIGPLSIRISEANTAIMECFSVFAGIIEQQQQEIDVLNERLAQVGRMLNGEAEDK